MRLLMATRANESTIEEYGKFTLPILRMFAERWKADFKILDDSMGSHPWEIMILHELLMSYDRALYIDSDIVINKNCPNIFDIVPLDIVGLVFEDKGSRLKNRRGRIAQIKSIYGGNEDWVSGYFNSGMFVASRQHKEIFTKINGKLWGTDFRVNTADQTHFNYQLMKQGHKYIDLGYKWNHISPFSEPWNGSPSRFDSYIIHYAGRGKFPDKGERSRSQLIKDDIKQIYGDSYAHLG